MAEIPMISVTVNKEEFLFPEGMTIIELLEKRDAKARSAVWVNGKQLLLAEYPTWEIKDGDTIKILRVVAGG